MRSEKSVCLCSLTPDQPQSGNRSQSVSQLVSLSFIGSLLVQRRKRDQEKERPRARIGKTISHSAVCLHVSLQHFLVILQCEVSRSAVMSATPSSFRESSATLNPLRTTVRPDCRLNDPQTHQPAKRNTIHPLDQEGVGP